MRFLVAGGAGFLGSHLVDRLIDSSENNEVYVVDNLSTGSLDNLKHLEHHDRFLFLNGDIRFDRTMERLYNCGFDVIYNMACPASPVHYQKTPIITTLTCVLGTYNLLSLAFEEKARILQASTSEVYGDPSVHPQTEDYWGNVNSFGPRSCYDEGKRAAESLVYDFRNLGTDTRIVRIFNTYGPRMAVDDGRVVSNFICQGLRGENITIFGDGKQTRSFCFVDDMIEGLLTVMRSDCKEPVNLGNPTEFNMLQLAEQSLTLTKSSSTIVFNELPKDDPRQRKPNIDRAKSLGWEPTIPLEEGLARTVKYFRQKLQK